MAKKRRHRRNVQRSSMEAYVAKHIKSATSKLRYLEKKGGYKASSKAQQAKASLRMLYRKMGVDENSYHTGKTFTKLLISNADLRVLYNTIKDIRSIDTKKVNLEYKKLEKEYEEYGVSYADSFNYLSTLSSEFHEVFAFLTYDDIKTSYKEEGGVNNTMLFAEFLNTISDKILDEKQTENAKKLISKMQNNLSAKTILEMQSIYGDTINKVMGIKKSTRKYTSQSTRPRQSTGRNPVSKNRKK